MTRDTQGDGGFYHSKAGDQPESVERSRVGRCLQMEWFDQPFGHKQILDSKIVTPCATQASDMPGIENRNACGGHYDLIQLGRSGSADARRVILVKRSADYERVRLL